VGKFDGGVLPGGQAWGGGEGRRMQGNQAPGDDTPTHLVCRLQLLLKHGCVARVEPHLHLGRQRHRQRQHGGEGLRGGGAGGGGVG